MRIVVMLLVVLGLSTPAHANTSLSGYAWSLASKAEEIVTFCHSHIISTYRPGALVAGTKRVSLHASRRAVDISGNPSCIYDHLKGWPGGYSTDYSAVRHVHISYGGREDGKRFVHGGHRHHYHHRHRKHRTI